MMSLNIALLQLASHGFEQEANLNKGLQYCRKAANLGADLVLFPEMWNIGYTPFSDEAFNPKFDPKKYLSSAAVTSWQARAITQNDNFIKQFQNLAKELKIAIAITYLEKHQPKPRNTVSIIDQTGKIILTYAKTHTCDFSLEAFCTPGEDFPVCELITKQGKVKIGCMICFDREFPEPARILMLNGAEIILLPNACEIEINRRAAMQTRAFENMCGIAIANYPAPQQNGHSLAFDGMAFDHNGQSRDMCLLEAAASEGIYIAEFDVKKLRDYRNREVWGDKYRRPGIYNNLNKTS